ncbi:MAG TPA: peptidylprolyl isomerase [Hanamia sp.]|jgi:peptidyl-prolyl cis-trans isomerase SurA|nr:peptidylprolyl isomerase [Hanamia sp.]
MKKLFLAVVCSSFIFISYSQTLFTYGNHSVNADEFLTAFNKNKTFTTDSVQALRDYLDLYIKFKLKVQAAKDIHLDTLPSMKADLQNFRSQIQDNYLDDEKEVNRLVNEAFDRSQKDIHVLYYFVNNHQTSDSVNDLKTINNFAKELRSNEKNEAEIFAKANANTAIKIQKGDAGYITVFSLPYQFENIVYSLKPGESSQPFQTKKGWYVFKNVGERKAVGKITVAQILFAVPEGFDQQRAATKKLADSVYDALMNGSDFATLAKEFSDDKNTFMNGGIMPEFGTAKYDSVFENHAFSLKKDGEISKPFATEFGYHIIKRISATPVPVSKTDEAYLYNLKQEVLKDARNEVAKQKFLKEIFPVIGFKKNIVNEENLWQVSDSSLMANKNTTIGKVNANTVLFSFNNNKTVKVADWILYLQNSNAIPGNDHNSYKELFPQFIKASAFSNYALRLQNYNIAFKKQLEEFKDGNMLFEIMQQKVWSKAAEDTVGLKNYYNTHKEKYFWTNSADAIIFSCTNKTVADNAIAELRRRKTWREVIAADPAHIQADSGRYELGQIPVIDRTIFRDGLITLPVINKNDGTAVFAQIIKVYPDHEPRNFQDARGLVINDYQNYLEEKWIEQLKKKYPVKINEKVLDSLLHNTAF